MRGRELRWLPAALGCACATLVQASPDPEAAAPAPVPTVPVDTAPAEAPPADRSATTLDNIVVTARRRKENLADVPASLMVLDGEALNHAGLTLPTDLQERVPGLIVSVPNARLTSYTIRGLGSSSANDGIESSVGLFLDGIYLGRQGVSIFDLIDLDRVEVLRGPQGTLSGKNTTAGAINIVTKAPSQQHEVNAEVTGGYLNARLLRASSNDATDDGQYAGRVTGYLSQRDGTVDNAYNGARLNDRNKYGARAQGLWTFTGGTGRLIAEYAGSREDCCAFPLTAPVRKTVQNRDAYMEYTRLGTDPAQHLTDSDAPTRSKMHQESLSAEFNWDLAGGATLTSVGGWRNWYFLPLNDDATSLKLASTSTLNKHQQFSEELRLTQSVAAADIVGGVFYIHQRLRGLERVILGKDIGGWVFGGAIRDRSNASATQSNSGPALYAIIPPESLDGTTIDTNYFQRSDGVAGFGSIDWHLTDALDFTTGARYTHEWKEAAVDRHRYGGDPNASPLSNADAAGPALAAYPEFGEALGQDPENVTWKGILDDVAGGEYTRGNHMREGNWNAQLALSYAVSSFSRIYASTARGYKGGGINLGFTGTSIAPVFKPEQATSYELGAKLRLFDAVFLSAAVYDTSIKDYQALTFDNEQTLLRNPRQINLLNIGRVKLQGAELEGYGYLLPGLSARGGVAYNKAVMTSFPNAPNEVDGQNTRDLSGQRLYNAPTWSGNLGTEYKHFLPTGQELYVGVDWSARTGYWGTVEHGKASYIQGHTLTNARIGVRPLDKLWDAWVWSRNLLDADYVAAVYPLYGVGDYGAVPGDARTIGVTVRMELR